MSQSPPRTANGGPLSPPGRPAVPGGLWNRGFVLACLANIMMFFNVHFLLSTVAAYTVARFAVGDTVGGAVASVFIVGTLISRLLAGPLIERFGSRPLLLVGFIAFIVAPLLYWASGEVWALLLVRAVHGLTFGVSSSVIAAAAVNRVPGTRMSEGTSHYSSSTLIGVAAGPMVGLALGGTGFGTVAVIASAVSLAGLVIALFMDVRPRDSEPALETPDVPEVPAVVETDGAATAAAQNPSAPPEAARPWWARYVEPGAAPTAAIGALYSLGYAGIVTFLATLVSERDFGTVASLFFAVYAGTVLVSRLFTGRLMDRRGANIVMLPAFLLFAAGLATIAVAGTVMALMAAAVLVGLGYGQLQSAGQVICVTQVPRERAGMGASTYFLGIDAGMGLGPLLAGALVQWWGTTGLYWVLAGFLVALVPVYWLVQGRHLQRGRS
ncbi:MFS transporter [Citricoccus nitrophenolicus]|uniref:Putative MFS family arabinose efflux permease n=1 Tax=Citricoccus muralis TaxID=169134 RepID=A0A3D9LGF6_9MICC|nr:MFS transporter [Citricoccus muralis]REE05232.1 putative MFS family arabinose efflux permease [Citricoccus muralis]